MKVVLATLSCLLALTASVFAQGGGCLSGGPGAVKVDSFQVNLSFEGAESSQYPSDGSTSTAGATGGGGMKVSPTGKASGGIAVEVSVFNIQGRPAISISDGNVQYKGDPAAMGNMTAAELFRMLTQAAIGQAVARGDIACTPDCSAGNNVVQVIQPACVHREPSSDGMNFVTCDTYSCCVKTFMVCCPDGASSPIVKEIASKSGGCADPKCESTCQ